jgi:ABC-type transport system involved in multi-copper enzyme maturation permease subunit
MRWQMPLSLGGPVLQRELTRAARRPLPRMLHYGYIAWLFLLVMGSLPGMSADANTRSYSEDDYQRWVHRKAIDVGHDRWIASTALAASSLSFLLHQQLALILLLTPALTAGALGHEKERNTLMALLCTELESDQIVIGKLLGRLAPLLRLSLTTLPILLFMAVWADFPCSKVFLPFAQAVVLTFAVASVCMLSAVWTRRTSDAVLGCYTILVLTYFATTYVASPFGLLDLLDPVVVLDQLLAPGGLSSLDFAVHLVLWGSVGVITSALTVKRLRPDCLEQQEQRANRWLWALRPRMDDQPVRWREQHVIGLAPLPLLRIVPTWLGMLGVLCFSAIVALTAFRPTAWDMCVRAMLRGQFSAALQVFRTMVLPGFNHPGTADLGTEISVMGFILVVSAVLVVGARCASSIAEEKRRKTWEDLILTSLSLSEIVEGKRWGVVRATIPYLAMYALPMLALSGLGGSSGVFAAIFWLTATCVAILAAAWFGLEVAAGEYSGEDPTNLERGPRPFPAEPIRGWGPEEQ